MAITGIAGRAQKKLGIDPGVQADVNPCDIDLLRKVTQSLVEFLFSGNGFRHVELPKKNRARVKAVRGINAQLQK